MVTAAIFNFVTMAFWSRGEQGVILYNPEKFESNPSTLSDVITIILKTNTAAVRHFGIVVASFGTTCVVYLVIYAQF